VSTICWVCNCTCFSSPVFSGFAHKIKEDHVNRQLLFLGTESGLFATLDGGLNWFRMKNNIPEFALVRDLQIHPKTHDLIIGTHGRGVFILDDIRALRELNPEVWEKDFHLFTTEPLLLNNGPLGWGGPEISGANGQGETIEEAKENLKLAIQLIIEDRMADIRRGITEDAIEETILIP